MVLNFEESHHVEQHRSTEQLVVVAVGKIERFPMDSKLVVGFAVAIHNFHKNITITSHENETHTHTNTRQTHDKQTKIWQIKKCQIPNIYSIHLIITIL